MKIANGIVWTQQDAKHKNRLNVGARRRRVTGSFPRRFRLRWGRSWCPLHTWPSARACVDAVYFSRCHPVVRSYQHYRNNKTRTAHVVLCGFYCSCNFVQILTRREISLAAFRKLTQISCFSVRSAVCMPTEQLSRLLLRYPTVWLFIHSFRSLPYDRSIDSATAISQNSAI
jgi:hypothetical protein